MKAKHLSLFLVFCALAVTIGACGKRSPLIIPRPHQPVGVTDLKATLGCGYVMLTWTPPTKNQDNSPVSDLQAFVVFRKRGERYDPTKRAKTFGLGERAESTIVPTPSALTEGLQLGAETTGAAEADTAVVPDPDFVEVARVTLAELTDSQQSLASDTPALIKLAFADRYSLLPEEQEAKKAAVQDENAADPAPESQGFLVGYDYSYKIVAETRKKHRGLDSNITQIVYAVQPGPPDGLTASLGERKITLTWRAPSHACTGESPIELLGYNIYRAAKPDFSTALALNPKPQPELTYIDANVTNDTQYYYCVRAVSKTYSVIGPRSETLAVTMEDQYPPGPPQNLSVVSAGTQVNLIWLRNREPDVAGYNVYRSTRKTKQPVKINSELVTRSTFVDASVITGVEYTYYITAVDNSQHQNESQASDLVSILFQ